MIKYRIKDVAFECDETSGKSRIITGIEQLPDGVLSYKECITEDNPICAFNIFMSRAMQTLREPFLDAIEAGGFNRYTGQREVSGNDV